MRLWRLIRPEHRALDGSGAEKHGSRWTSPGTPVIHFASEPGLAVLIVLRYHLADATLRDQEFLLGWTETDLPIERLPFAEGAEAKRAIGDAWLQSGRSAFARVQSAVLPETDIVLMNPRHWDAAGVQPLTTRPFRFGDCLHLAPLPPNPDSA